MLRNLVYTGIERLHSVVKLSVWADVDVNCKSNQPQCYCSVLSMTPCGLYMKILSQFPTQGFLSAVHLPCFTCPEAHNLCFDFGCSFKLARRDSLMWVLSACLLLAMCVALPGKDQRVIYKSTSQQTVGVKSYPAILLSAGKGLTSSFDAPALRSCGVWWPQRFCALISCQSIWHQRRVDMNECSSTCMFHHAELKANSSMFMLHVLMDTKRNL